MHIQNVSPLEVWFRRVGVVGWDGKTPWKRAMMSVVSQGREVESINGCDWFFETAFIAR